MAGAVDVLVIDEAGQMSLANTLAVCQAGPSLVLLGDPRQLGYRPDPCGNTLQGLNSSPWVLPSRPPGRGRPAAAGDRRGSVRKKRTFWVNSLAPPRNMTGSVVRICQEIPRSRIPWTGRSTVQQDVRSATLISERTREAPLPWAPSTALQRTRRTG